MKSVFKSSILLIALALALSNCSEKEELIASTPEINSDDAQLKGAFTTLLWDDFKDATTWNRWAETSGRTDYNSSFCNYDQSYVDIGTKDSKTVLIITAKKINGKYYSGHVKSKSSFAKPGNNQQVNIEASIKLVAQNGTTFKGFAQTYGVWPAFWSTNEDNWPKKGEIDIVEGYSKGTSTYFASNLWYGTTSLQTNVSGLEQRYSLGEGWHTYSLGWKNSNGAISLSIYVDGNHKKTYTNSSHPNLNLNNFDSQNVIFNLCVGDDKSIFDESQINLQGVTMMWVDWVVVKKKNL